MKFHPLCIILLSLSFTFCVAQSTATIQVSTFTIEAPQLQTDKKIWIYLPKDYVTTAQEYPVVYMHDAQNLFDVETSFLGEWEVDEYLDSVAKQKSIIIGIAHGDEKRAEELTPYPHPEYGGGQGDYYLNFIIQTLKPYVDSTYRTLKDPKHTTIFGSSLGGLMSFYAIIKHPEVFGNAGIFSPSFWFSNRIFDLVSEKDIPSTSRFYFMAGSEESDTMVPDQEKMIALLSDKGVAKDHIKNIVIEGGKHNEALWRKNFPDAYEWLIGE